MKVKRSTFHSILVGPEVRNALVGVFFFCKAWVGSGPLSQSLASVCQIVSGLMPPVSVLMLLKSVHSSYAV
jgi:hypothetical protein